MRFVGTRYVVRITPFGFTIWDQLLAQRILPDAAEPDTFSGNWQSRRRAAQVADGLNSADREAVAEGGRRPDTKVARRAI